MLFCEIKKELGIVKLLFTKKRTFVVFIVSYYGNNLCSIIILNCSCIIFAPNCDNICSVVCGGAAGASQLSESEAAASAQRPPGQGALLRLVT